MSCAGTYAGCYTAGDDMYFPLTFTENDGVTPIDLTGATAKMDLRLNVTDAMVAQSMTGGIVDAVNGMMEFTLTDEETAALVPREEVNKLFVYSVKITYPDLTEETILTGQLTFEQVVTE